MFLIFSPYHPVTRQGPANCRSVTDSTQRSHGPPSRLVDAGEDHDTGQVENVALNRLGRVVQTLDKLQDITSYNQTCGTTENNQQLIEKQGDINVFSWDISNWMGVSHSNFNLAFMKCQVFLLGRLALRSTSWHTQQTWWAFNIQSSSAVDVKGHVLPSGFQAMVCWYLCTAISKITENKQQLMLIFGW